jgi:hypothetical protein
MKVTITPELSKKLKDYSLLSQHPIEEVVNSFIDTQLKMRDIARMQGSDWRLGNYRLSFWA